MRDFPTAVSRRRRDVAFRAAFVAASLGALAVCACSLTGLDSADAAGDGGSDDGTAFDGASRDAGGADGTVAEAAADAGALPDRVLYTCDPETAAHATAAGEAGVVSFSPLPAFLADASAAPSFGASLALTPTPADGGLVWLAVGAPLAGSSSAGAVEVIGLSYGDYIQSTMFLLDTGAKPGDALGTSVALSPDGRYLAIGAAGDERIDAAIPGAVDLYALTVEDQGAQCWSFVTRIVAPPSSPVRFGAAVALAASDAGAELIVGAPGATAALGNAFAPPGVAFLYDLSLPAGAVDPRLVDVGANPVSFSEQAPGDGLGFSVASSADGRLVLIGAPGGQSGEGVAYGTDVAQFGTNVVTLDFSTMVGAQYGQSVAVTNDGQYAVVGLPGQGGGGVDLFTGPSGNTPLSHVATFMPDYVGIYGTSTAITPTTVYLGSPSGPGTGAVVPSPITPGPPPSLTFTGMLVNVGALPAEAGLGTALTANDQGIFATSASEPDQPATAGVYVLHP